MLPNFNLLCPGYKNTNFSQVSCQIDCFWNVCVILYCLNSPGDSIVAELTHFNNLHPCHYNIQVFRVCASTIMIVDCLYYKSTCAILY